jgi:hypothetical protein
MPAPRQTQDEPNRAVLAATHSLLLAQGLTIFDDIHTFLFFEALTPFPFGFL